jgi:hypothetical protein
MAELDELVALPAEGLRWLGARAEAAGLNRLLPAELDERLDEEQGWNIARVVLPFHERQRFPGDPESDVPHHRLGILVAVQRELLPAKLLADVTDADWRALPAYGEAARADLRWYGAQLCDAITTVMANEGRLDELEAPDPPGYDPTGAHEVPGVGIMFASPLGTGDDDDE